LLLSLAVAGAASAADEWLKLQAPSFGVVSQLDEEDTRAWAVEFEQFIDALHQLFSAENVALPPLTIVLFKQPKGFNPYRMQTDSGQARVAGFFGNAGTWSVIGLAGRGDELTRWTIQHEAVHWFATAADAPSPLWFDEGFAETLSTFRIVDGKGRWGEPVVAHVKYLGASGLMPLDELFRATQDEALHSRGARYYPQAWAFVHFLMFGNGGKDRGKLASFVRELRETDLDSAVSSVFAKSYDELTTDLRRYLESGRYGYAEIELRDRAEEMTIEPAPDAAVEFALARLAAAGGNHELANEHIDAVLRLAPRSPAGYEMRAYVAARTENTAVAIEATDRAIELGSREPSVYLVKADRIVATEHREAAWDDLLPPETARAAADLYGRAIGLQPRNRDAYEGLVTALLNVDDVTDGDRALLSGGRLLFPTDALLLVGLAAAEKHDGNDRESVALLRRATAEPFTMDSRFRPAVSALHVDWTAQWIHSELETLLTERRFDDARALLDAQLADPHVTGRLRTMLDGVAKDVAGFGLVQTAQDAFNDGDVEQAHEVLQKILADPNISTNLRKIVERALEHVNGEPPSRN
jgi:tetratricopeptide (TPR) repeat protein